MKRTYYSSEEKAQLIDEYKSRQERENITVSAYALEKGINEYTFSNWLYRRKPINSRSGNFVKVKADTSNVTGSVSVEYCGARLEVSFSQLSSVLKALRDVR